MKYINFKSTDLKPILLSCIFICSLLTSQQVFARIQNFAVATSDGKEIAQGSYEELPDSIAKINITLLGHEYSGTGGISKSLAKPAKGLRADRAMMATKHKKRVAAELIASDGAKLACELNLQYGDIWGQCVNPNSQKIFTIKASSEDAK